MSENFVYQLFFLFPSLGMKYKYKHAHQTRHRYRYTDVVNNLKNHIIYVSVCVDVGYDTYTYLTHEYFLFEKLVNYIKDIICILIEKVNKET